MILRQEALLPHILCVLSFPLFSTLKIFSKLFSFCYSDIYHFFDIFNSQRRVFSFLKSAKISIFCCCNSKSCFPYLFFFPFRINQEMISYFCYSYWDRKLVKRKFLICLFLVIDTAICIC